MDIQKHNDLKKLTTEILVFKQQAAVNIIGWGKAALGENASLKQIANYVGPQLGLRPSECMKILAATALKTGGEILE